MYNFNENLKELIIEKDLSLRKIAKESGFTSGQLSEYLHGVYPTVDKAIKLADYFNCSLDFLFGVSDIKVYNKSNKNAFNSNLFLERYQIVLQKNGLTHWKFTRRNELTESTLRHWQKGRKPLIESLIIIAINLDTSIDYLIGRVDCY